jgi:hypothetical protein
MNKKELANRIFIIALTLYCAFFIWTVWFKSPGNYFIISILEEWYIKSIGKVFSLILITCVIMEGVFRGVSSVVDRIRNKIIKKHVF